MARAAGALQGRGRGISLKGHHCLDGGQPGQQTPGGRQKLLSDGGRRGDEARQEAEAPRDAAPTARGVPPWIQPLVQNRYVGYMPVTPGRAGPRVSGVRPAGSDPPMPHCPAAARPATVSVPGATAR
eukprot:763474-Hanusia_phi.AAC.3